MAPSGGPVMRVELRHGERAHAGRPEQRRQRPPGGGEWQAGPRSVFSASGASRKSSRSTSKCTGDLRAAPRAAARAARAAATAGRADRRVEVDDRDAAAGRSARARTPSGAPEPEIAPSGIQQRTKGQAGELLDGALRCRACARRPSSPARRRGSCSTAHVEVGMGGRSRPARARRRVGPARPRYRSRRCSRRRAGGRGRPAGPRRRARRPVARGPRRPRRSPPAGAPDPGASGTRRRRPRRAQARALRAARARAAPAGRPPGRASRRPRSSAPR